MEAAADRNWNQTNACPNCQYYFFDQSYVQKTSQRTMQENRKRKQMTCYQTKTWQSHPDGPGHLRLKPMADFLLLRLMDFDLWKHFNFTSILPNVKYFKNCVITRKKKIMVYIPGNICCQFWRAGFQFLKEVFFVNIGFGFPGSKRVQIQKGAASVALHGGSLKLKKKVNSTQISTQLLYF